MPSNYRAIEAFARGLMSALLRDGEAEAKTPRPQFIKPADIDAAVQRYIDAALAGQPQEPPPDAHEPGEPQMPFNFEEVLPPDMAQTVREVAGDMRDLERPVTSVPGVTQEMEQQSQSYDPNMPGEGATWQTPRS